MNALEDESVGRRGNAKGDSPIFAETKIGTVPNTPTFLPQAWAVGQTPEIQDLHDNRPAFADRPEHLPDRPLDRRHVGGQRQRIADAYGGVERLGRRLSQFSCQRKWDCPLRCCNRLNWLVKPSDGPV